MRRSALFLLSLLASLVSLQAEETSLTVRWDLSEPLGGARQARYTAETGNLRSWPDYPGANGVRIIYQDPSAYFSLRFGAKDRRQLVTGRYLSSTASWDHPTGDMSVTGWGQQCYPTGRQWFEVKQIEYGATGTVTRCWIIFEIPCLYGEGSVMGDIRYNADAPVSLMAPLARGVQKLDSLSFEVRASSELAVAPVLAAGELPAGARFTDHEDGTGTFAWDTGFHQVGIHNVRLTATDSAGRVDRFTTTIEVTQTTSLLLDSEPGQGRTWYFAPTYETGVGNNHRGGMSAWFPDYLGFALDFAAPFDRPLSIGTYLEAGRFPLHHQDQPGMRVGGDHGECAGGARNFEIKEVSYGTIGWDRSLWAVFDQSCDEFPGTLRGELRINADVPVLLRSPWYKEVIEESELAYTIRSADRGDRAFTLEATQLPPGAMFTDHGDNSGTFSWTPEYGQAGDHKSGFTATNSAGETDRAFTAIRVNLRNDEFNNATPVPVLPFVDERDLGLATTAPDDPSCVEQPWMSPVEWTVWYGFTPTTDLPVFVSTDSSPSVSISVFTGARNALDALACGTSSPFFFEATADQTYFIRIGSYGNPGRTEIRMDVAPPLEIRMDVNPRGVLTPARDSARLTGTIDCSRKATVHAWLMLEGLRGRQIRGSASLRLDCSRSDQWSADMHPDGDRLAPGRYRARISGVAFDDETGRYALIEQERSVLLRP